MDTQTACQAKAIYLTAVLAGWLRIGKLLDEFSATECSNYLANSGYAQHDRKPL
jgi:hypothetical protein